MWRLKAFRLKENDDMEKLHRLAWLNQVAGATEEVGYGKNKTHKMKFSKFEDFYNHAKVEEFILNDEKIEEQIKETQQKEKNIKSIKDLMLTANKLNSGGSE